MKYTVKVTICVREDEGELDEVFHTEVKVLAPDMGTATSFAEELEGSLQTITRARIKRQLAPAPRVVPASH